MELDVIIGHWSSKVRAPSVPITQKKSIFSLSPNGLILPIFLVVQYLVGSLKIPADGSNNLIFLTGLRRAVVFFNSRFLICPNISSVSEKLPIECC